MANRTAQVSECLSKLYDLMPDGIINYEVSLSQGYRSFEKTLTVDLGLYYALLDGIDSIRSTGK